MEKIMDTKKDYKFAIGRSIKQIFTESELYLDGKYNEEHPWEKTSVIRLDKPLYILLDNGEILRLYSTSLSIAAECVRERILCSAEAVKSAFNMLRGRTVTDVQEWYENKYEIDEDSAECFDGLGRLRDFDKPTDLVIILDNGLRLICYSSWDYFDIEIVE